MQTELIITPKTRVLQLIEAYPELEDTLINYVPEFRRLKNPVLRKTVARIATLQQAAAIGKVPVEELINTLRQQVGQDLISAGESSYTTGKPHWFKADLIHHELDARPMLAQGEHPVNQVMADYMQMPPGRIYKMTAPFLPAPLIDKLSSLGAQHWVEEAGGQTYHVYFYKEQID